MNIPVFDLHCDTALALLGRDMKQRGNLRKNQLHIDLERAATLGCYAQCFACFTTPYMTKWHGVSPEIVFERELEGIMLQLQENSDLISQAVTPEQIEENRKNGKMSAILTIEGPAGFGFDPAMLQTLYNAGFRITSLGWNESNVLAGSHKTGEGLTDLGREYVKEAQRLGMLVDVSHLSDKGFWDLMEITQAPIIATHSNSRTVCDVSRNLTDEMFLAICNTGGVAGFNQCAPFVGQDPDLDTICDHILHFLTLDPTGKHIALGGDLDGCDELPNGFDGVQSYPAMAQRLIDRGVSENIVEDIFWNNALGVMKRAVHNHTR
jgi:membrane dipeptidase